MLCNHESRMSSCPHVAGLTLVFLIFAFKGPELEQVESDCVIGYLVRSLSSPLGTGDKAVF